ncbi:hypothetical protein [Nostoc sp. WHI]|uniref:hypothetical protein n=1 Tax=Nostoc sp. WHI TaxID=2650611 RepID=UPI0018C52A46|nr:hypothetical protein [Nostoc sp. WHI]MBG1266367.1 hypothetical protein [Nostoc sp. WHI]
MTPSVAGKTPIPAKIWRRHTDPPGLWISVVIGSVSLHLLAFWLMRSSNALSLWFPQQSESAVPIELIDIAPKTKSTTKTVSPKPLSSTQKSVPARSLQTERTTSINQNFGAANSADNLQPKTRNYASQPSNPLFPQQTVPAPTPTSKVPVSNFPLNRRQEIKLGKGTPLPTGIPSEAQVPQTPTRETLQTPTRETPQTPTRETLQTPTRETPQTPTRETPQTPTRETPQTPTRETPQTPTRETPQTPTRETPQTPTRETPQTPTRETPPASTEGASVATVTALSRDEVSNLIQTGKFRSDGLPDVIALYRGSNTKQLNSSFLPRDSEVQPAKILASLVIDNNGIFQQAVVLEIEPATLQSEKSTYERVLNEVFKTENFLAAQNNDGTKPGRSNLYVRINIQPVNSN